MGDRKILEIVSKPDSTTKNTAAASRQELLDRVSLQCRLIETHAKPGLHRPRIQLTSLINNARSGKIKNTGFQLYLNAVSKITPKFSTVIEEINFRENDMIVLCTVRDLSSLDTIKQAFNEFSLINAEPLSSAARDGKVTGRFRLSSRI